MLMFFKASTYEEMEADLLDMEEEHEEPEAAMAEEDEVRNICCCVCADIFAATGG